MHPIPLLHIHQGPPPFIPAAVIVALILPTASPLGWGVEVREWGWGVGWEWVGFWLLKPV